MIPRTEFYIALNLAIAAASAPQGKETPLDGIGNRQGLDVICFDFHTGGKLQIAGTNGRRIAVSTLLLPDYAPVGKFVVPINQAGDALLTFCPDSTDTRTVSIGLFGIQQLILTCSGGVDAMMVDNANSIFPEFNAILNGSSEPTKDAVYDAHTLGWVMEQIASLADNGVAVHVSKHGPTTFRPQLSGYRCLQEVMIALKPAHTW